MSPIEYRERIWPLRQQLYQVSLKILRRPSLAEDAVQEVLIKAWENREQWAHLNSWKAWLLTLTRNKSLDYLKSRHNKSADLENAPEKVEISANPYEKTEQSDLMKKLKNFLEELKPQHKAVFELREFGQMSYAEIAQELSITESQVKVALHRARLALRKKLQTIMDYGK